MTATQHPPLPNREDDPYIAYRPPFPAVDMREAATALLTIDMQNACANERFGVMAAARAAGRSNDADYFRKRLKHTAIPNIQSLHAVFRSAGKLLIHTRIESLTASGLDRSPVHKTLGIHEEPGSEGAQFLSGLTPVDGEIVLTKTSSSVFNSTNIHYVLTNCGIRNLVVCGCVTTGCVETAVRDAADLGYHVVLVEDACAAVVEQMHWASVRSLRDVYAQVVPTSQVVATLTRPGAP